MLTDLEVTRKMLLKLGMPMSEQRIEGVNYNAATGMPTSNRITTLQLRVSGQTVRYEFDRGGALVRVTTG